MSELTLEGQELKIGTKLAWELSAEEVIFPFDITVGQREVQIFVHMKPYRSSAFKQLLADTNAHVRVDGQDNSEIVKMNQDKVEDFFWKHFARFSGHGGPIAEDDIPVEKQKEWIKQNPRFFIPTRTVWNGYGGIQYKIVPELAESNGHSKLFSFDLDVDQSIALTQRVHFSGRSTETLSMLHHLRRETANESYRYDRATDKQVLHRKQQTYERVSNYDVLEQLYDALVESVDGMTIGGKACEISNKDEWAKLVPFWHKHQVLAQFFAGVQAKNA